MILSGYVLSTGYRDNTVGGQSHLGSTGAENMASPAVHVAHSNTWGHPCPTDQHDGTVHAFPDTEDLFDADRSTDKQAAREGEVRENSWYPQAS